MQTITAVSATKQDTEALGVPKGAPLLRVERTTWDAHGQRILRSEARYNPLLTEFVADLPPAVHDMEPGLRLIHQPVGSRSRSRHRLDQGSTTPARTNVPERIRLTREVP